MSDDALLKAISKYLANRNYESFDTNIIRLLNLIYNEIDLINPYLLQNYELINNNLARYGLSKTEVLKFRNSFNLYMQTKDQNAFFTIYKIIMDMIACKYRNSFIKDEEVKQYEAIFFKGISSNPLKEYWDKTLYKINNKIILNKINDNVFNPYAYYLHGKTMADIKEMSNEEIKHLNYKILKEYNLKMSDHNLTKKLNKALDKVLNPIPLTSGNGFVDIITYISFIATEILVGAIIAISFIKR